MRLGGLILENNKTKANEGGIGVAMEDLEQELTFSVQKKSKLPKNLGKIIIALIIIAVLAACSYLVYTLFFQEEEVETMTAFSYVGVLERKISGNGPTMSKDRQAVVGLAEGEVLEVFVQDGDYVEVGMPLFTVSDVSLREQMEEKMELLEADLEAINEIYEEIDGQTLTADFAGKTMEVTVEVGDEVTIGKKVGLLVDDSVMKATFDFSIAFIDQIEVGDFAQVSLPYSMALVDGEVIDIEKANKITTEGAIVFEVTVAIDNPGALTKDMVAMVAVQTAYGEATPASPSKLEYMREENINALTSGQVTSLEMSDHYVFGEGDVLMTVQNEGLSERLTAAEEKLEVSQSAYDELFDKLEHYNPVAEISGTVTGVTIAPGDKLSGGSSVVMNISDLSSMIMEVDIDERDVANIQVGMEVNVSSDNGGMFIGRFTKIALEGVMEGYSGMSVFPAEIEIMGTEGVMSGMWMRYDAVVSRVENCLLVPANAINYTEEGSVVFVREVLDGMTESTALAPELIPVGFKAVIVEVGESDDYNVQILSGITENVEVATTGIIEDPYGGMYGGYYGW